MPFREKMAWVTLLATVIAYGGFLVLVGPQVFRLDAGRLALSSGVITALVVFAVAFFGLGALFLTRNIRDARTPEDERERGIHLNAQRAALRIMEVAVFAILFTETLTRDVAVMANALVAALMLSEMVQSAWIIVSYRRSAG